MAGPLTGVKIIELAGIGPGPFCGMMLSDMGAEILRIDRANAATGSFPEGPRADSRVSTARRRPTRAATKRSNFRS